MQPTPPTETPIEETPIEETPIEATPPDRTWGPWVERHLKPETETEGKEDDHGHDG